ncbi:dipeptidase [Planococcus ruber]|uniref:dipeptidase n=1 Tax=Planococcus ruber TaxID=2027871 RepID=UPI001FEF1070|nr:membrane dipeptidase [Planococcus ruber]MCJ1910073.1 dipeptidase [Planococcus ruber]
MKIIDMHSDLFTDIAWRKSRGESNIFDAYHYPKLKAGLVETVICVFWVEPVFQQAPLERIQTVYRLVMEDLEHSKYAQICGSLSDALFSPPSDKINLIMGLEGLDFLGSSLHQLSESLSRLDEIGINHMSLTWNGRNDFASGTGSGNLQSGLTHLGNLAVNKANEFGWLVDASHLDDESFWNLYHYSHRPIIASHSNARTLCVHERNLTDAQLKAIAEKNGIVGLNSYWGFIDPKKPTLDRFVDHAIYIADLIGTEHLAFGFDFMDYLKGHAIGLEMAGSTKGLEDITRIPDLLEQMAKRGFTNKELEAIGYQNAIRLIESK